MPRPTYRLSTQRLWLRVGVPLQSYSNPSRFNVQSGLNVDCPASFKVRDSVDLFVAEIDLCQGQETWLPDIVIKHSPENGKICYPSGAGRSVRGSGEKVSVGLSLGIGIRASGLTEVYC